MLLLQANFRFRRGILHSWMISRMRALWFVGILLAIYLRIRPSCSFASLMSNWFSCFMIVVCMICSSQGKGCQIAVQATSRSKVKGQDTVA